MNFRVDARRQERPPCARCRFRFEEGYVWHAFGEAVHLCGECVGDLENSVNSYGEPPDVAARRFLDRIHELLNKSERQPAHVRQSR